MGTSSEGPCGSWEEVALTGLTQALFFALCPQAERVQLRARAHAQTGYRPEPGPAADGAHVSDRAQPMGVAPWGWFPARGTLITYVCPQADPVLPGPGRPDCPPESGDEARGAAQSQVVSSSGPRVGWGGAEQGGCPQALPVPTLRTLSPLPELTLPICPRDSPRHIDKPPSPGRGLCLGP